MPKRRWIGEGCIAVPDVGSQPKKTCGTKTREVDRFPVKEGGEKQKKMLFAPSFAHVHVIGEDTDAAVALTVAASNLPRCVLRSAYPKKVGE